jgi:hypothetical protein
MHRISINVLKQFLGIILFDTLGMEKFGTVGRRTFCKLVLFLTFVCHYLFNDFLAILVFAFLVFFVLCAVVIALTFADKALDHACLAILAEEVQISNLLQLVILHAQLLDLKF